MVTVTRSQARKAKELAERQQQQQQQKENTNTDVNCILAEEKDDEKASVKLVTNTESTKETVPEASNNTRKKEPSPPTPNAEPNAIIDQVNQLELGAPPLQEEEEEVFDDITTVRDFCTLIESFSPEEWKRRVAGLDSLVHVLVDGADSDDSKETKDDNSPPLQVEDVPQLSSSLAMLLQDPRSSVVKRTCVALTKLFQEACSHGQSTTSTAASLTNLWSHLMPTILDVHGLTSSVMRNLVQDFVVATLPLLSDSPPCDVIPLLLQRFEATKSKTMREACVLYITLALQHWTTSWKGDATITQQVGIFLIAALRDASPTVRSQARQGLDTLRCNAPREWEILVRSKPTQDPKLQAMLDKSLLHPKVSLEKLVLTKARPVQKPGRSNFAKFRMQQQQQQNHMDASN